jgi:hypothetical protein
MASISLRSSRRNEGLATRSSTRKNVAVRPGSGNNHSNAYTTQHLSNIGRKKRLRDSTDSEEHSIRAKRAKIAVEILPRPKAQPKTRSLVVRSNASSDDAPQPAPLPQTTTAPQTEPVPPPRKPTKHHDKVVNGIKHELDRLQANAADLKDEKRKLRSQEGARFKSELSAYFPEYDEVIGNEPKEERRLPPSWERIGYGADFASDLLNYETPIILVDNGTKTKPPHSAARKTNGQTHEYPLKEFPDSLFDDLNDAQRVDFSFLDPHSDEGEAEDPLSDAYFERIHRKPVRQEKTIRNTDRGRAQHERNQVIRLLEGLQGHDWLKLMGVSGVTDSKRKDFEPARAYFIKGCEVILEKFRAWREQEKRQKLEKEQAMVEAEAEEVEEEEEVGTEEAAEYFSDGDPPDYSDVDASAARQLHEEAIARSAAHLASRQERRTKVESTRPAHKLEKDFTSFFAKPYLREAALGKHRRSGRSVAAWGHPIPEVPQSDFNLPEEFRDEETLKTHARRKRRDRRVNKD